MLVHTNYNTNYISPLIINCTDQIGLDAIGLPIVSNSTVTIIVSLYICE